jgi:hypothetical protein
MFLRLAPKLPLRMPPRMPLFRPLARSRPHAARAPAPLAALAVGLAAAGPFAAPAAAEPTPLVVRVISQGAKFVGSSMGGARIVVSEADTGKILATGRTRGSTGDTERIMKTARTRGEGRLASDGAARFRTRIDIDRPTRVKVEAFGPLAQRQSAGTVSATQWLIPGVGIAGGDGWVLEMPGLVVDVLQPPTHRKFDAPQDSVPLSANVTLMCGCPLAPEEVPWDSDAYDIVAHVARDGQPAGEVPLTYAGTHSQFAAEIPTREPGLYEIAVTAHRPDTGNTGVDFVTFVVPQADDAQKAADD